MAETWSWSTLVPWCKWRHQSSQSSKGAWPTSCWHGPYWCPCTPPSSDSPWPATHQWGSCPTDVILASPRFLAAAKAAYLLPFGLPITMPGDHQTIRIDLDTCMLFGNQPPPSMHYTQTRGVNSNAIPTVQWFCTLVMKGWEKLAIKERVAQLMTKKV